VLFFAVFFGIYAIVYISCTNFGCS